MRKLLLSTVLAGTALAASPAQAAVFVCTAVGPDSCVTTDESVAIDKDSSPVTGLTSTSNIIINFTSTTDTLVGEANGLATVGSADGLLNQLTFQLQDGYSFATAEFNLEPYTGNNPNDPNTALKASNIVIAYYDPALKTYGTQLINLNGQNKLGIYGDNGERFFGVSFTADPSNYGISDLKQLKLGGVAPIPEPTTWAMMILGMGAVGATMRRRKLTSKVSFA